MEKNPWMTIAFVSAAVFIVVLMLVTVGNPGVDKDMSQRIPQIWGGAGEDFFVQLGENFEKILIGLALLSALILFSKDKRKESIVLVAAVGGGYIISSILKLAIQRPRPVLSAIQETGYSFPSNHAVVAAILFSLIIYFFASGIKNSFIREAFSLINAGLILIVGFSRIYLNVHWFTDVVGGFALGLVIAALAVSYLE